MLYTTDPLPIGEGIDAQIRLPLSFGISPDVPIRFIPRRIEHATWFHKVGCSIEPDSSEEQRHRIEMIITSYTITQGIEQVAEQIEEPMELEELS